MNGLDLVAQESIPTVLEHLRLSYSESYEVLGKRKDGSKFWLEMKGKDIVYKGVDARVVGFSDITDSKEAEDQLKLAASVFTHAREGIMITDANGILIEINDTFSEITGYSREEVIGKNPSILNSGQQDDKFYKDMWASVN